LITNLSSKSVKTGKQWRAEWSRSRELARVHREIDLGIDADDVAFLDDVGDTAIKAKADDAVVTPEEASRT
jgi:hypothetical protein